LCPPVSPEARYPLLCRPRRCTSASAPAAGRRRSGPVRHTRPTTVGAPRNAGGPPAQYPTRNARSNCVVDEEGPFTFTLPPGNYRIQANVFLGAFAYNHSTVNVVYLHVLPAPPPPPPFEDPCGPFGCGRDIG
jgi:hypothetical protein